MQLSHEDLILVTGATGLVGSHVVQQAVGKGLRVRALCRSNSDTSRLSNHNIEIVRGDLSDADSLLRACRDATVIVHCAAKVGDWGPTSEYRNINVRGTEALARAALQTGCLKRWVQISSLGVYAGTDHYGTDEKTPPSTRGIDGYTLTKAESEQLVRDMVKNDGLPAVILRPGFIYGPGDRTVMPRLFERLKSGRFAYLGAPDKLMNNTYVGNLCEAVWLAIEHDEAVGEVFNIRDPRSVTKREFIETICRAADLPLPQKTVPLPVAEFLAWHMEKLWKLLRRPNAPLVNSARVKFLGRNLDFSIEKARRHLGYDPTTDFRDAMTETVRNFVTATPPSDSPS